MHRIMLVASVILVSFPSLSLAQSTTSTETYIYDALGRLVEVDVAGGEEDGASRTYTYDDVDNRTQVVSTEGANSGSGGSSTLPTECALIGSEMPPLPDTDFAWPRVFVSSACQEDLQLSFTVEEISGQGSWSPGTFQGNDPILNAGPPGNETVKLAYVQPVAGSVPSGTQLVLQVNWQVDNFTGAGTTAESTVRIDGTGTGGEGNCLLGPVGFTTTQSGYAWPRVYAPTSAGCGYQIRLDYTITVQSGPISANQITSVFAANDDTLEGNEHAKVLVISPVAGVVSTNDPIVLHVNWIAPDGNASFASPGYSVVTINPD